jgi:hypothetical protein
VQGQSCTTQLLKVMNLWTDILDKGGTVNAVYLDFAKAFDTVLNQRLLIKLNAEKHQRRPLAENRCDVISDIHKSLIISETVHDRRKVTTEH